MRRLGLVRLPSYSQISCRPVFLPLCSKGYIIAALADANLNASGVRVERWLLVILLRARYAPRAIRFLRCRYALSTFPPSRTRCADCIGCDHAALQRRKETPCRSLRNQGLLSAYVQSEQLYAVIRKGAHSWTSHSNAPSVKIKRASLAALSVSPARKCLRSRSLARRPTLHFGNCSQASHRKNSPANRTLVRLPSLRRRQTVPSGRTEPFIGGIASLPSAKVEGNAERYSSRVAHIVSKQDHSVHGMHIILAVVVIFRFSLWMIRWNKTDSKLCASLTRHATGRRLSAVADGSTCKGASPRCIPRYRADEAHRYA
jgi:hypothetical protein